MNSTRKMIVTIATSAALACVISASAWASDTPTTTASAAHQGYGYGKRYVPLNAGFEIPADAKDTANPEGYNYGKRYHRIPHEGTSQPEKSSRGISYEYGKQYQRLG